MTNKAPLHMTGTLRVENNKQLMFVEYCRINEE